MAYNRFKLKINTPEGVFFEDEVLQVEIKTPKGYVAVLANHTPLIGAIIPSICYIRDSKNTRVACLVNGGMFYTDNNELNIVSDFFEFANNVNDTVLEKRKQRIVQAIKNKSYSSSTAIERIQTKLEEEFNNLKKLANSR